MLRHIMESQGGLSFTELLFLLLSYAMLVFVMLPVHELAHAAVATWLGDSTPRWHGRLTANPLKHLDPFGTAALVLFGIGYAKPVPVNPRNFSRPKLGMVLTSLAGPLSNLLMALLSLATVRVLYFLVPWLPVSENVFVWLIFVLVEVFAKVNLCLAAFNLLPIPPLDGFRVFGAILPARFTWFFDRYHQYVRLVVLVLILTDVLDFPLRLIYTLLGNLLCRLVALPPLF